MIYTYSCSWTERVQQASFEWLGNLVPIIRTRITVKVDNIISDTQEEKCLSAFYDYDILLYVCLKECKVWAKGRVQANVWIRWMFTKRLL